ncbi:HEAT repeat domain-containing protein [Actinoplanes sp. TRM 88003]|uniref:HEAT repeat domain-containing protein n=1 Tax=Paractinoplanes aksuensis TaxID=2939490 RepID=A0ABT1DYC4_9ACTN|nr:HEAT repeat domain-containing protein [Actinoplanes aksuensis]MCO8275862.1 HEAT repeat domain-containing protein [Actinoplanes aksuensis]
MFEKLDDVPWSDLRHAYGPADDVPGQLRALRSDDADVRKKSLWNLFGNIFHQGTRYEASAHAVPFLLELVAEPSTPSRESLIELLVALAIGYDESYLPGGFPLADLRAAAAGGDALLRDGGWARLDVLDEADQNRLLARVELNAYEAVAAGVPLFVSLLSDPSPAVRRMSAYALGWLPISAALGGAAASTPLGGAAVSSALGAAAVSSALGGAVGDGDASVAATAALSLGLLGAAAEGALDDPRPVVRGAAAIALAKAHGRAAPRAVVDELLRLAGNGEATDVPYLDGDLAGYAARSLALVLPDDSDEALDVLLGRIPAVTGVEALPVVGEALRRVFPDGSTAAGTLFDDLTERQKRVVRVLADSPSTWLFLERAFGNFAWLIGSYGLPSDADKMRAYIDAATTP